MLKTVLWIAAACAAILVALVVSRSLDFDKPVDKSAAPVESLQDAAPPPAPPAPPAPVEAAPAAPVVDIPPPVRTPDEQQILDDAAATGMTTMEPEAPPT